METPTVAAYSYLGVFLWTVITVLWVNISPADGWRDDLWKSIPVGLVILVGAIVGSSLPWWTALMAVFFYVFMFWAPIFFAQEAPSIVAGKDFLLGTIVAQILGFIVLTSGINVVAVTVVTMLVLVFVPYIVAKILQQLEGFDV